MAMNKKAELQKRIDAWVQTDDLKGDPSEWACNIAQEAINAIPDKAEKPTEPGLYLWREKPKDDWQGYNLKDAEKDSLFCQPTGGEWVDEMGGEWHPDRILMPGEE